MEVEILGIYIQESFAGISDKLVGINFVPAKELANINSLTFDILIIDTPPYLTETLSNLFSISDYVLVPSKRRFFDILAIKAALRIIRKVQEQNSDLKYGVVLNTLKSSTSLIDNLIGILESYGANVLKIQTYDRVAYMQSSITNGVFSTSNTKMHGEISSLTDEVLNSF